MFMNFKRASPSAYISHSSQGNLNIQNLLKRIEFIQKEARLATFCTIFYNFVVIGCTKILRQIVIIFFI